MTTSYHSLKILGVPGTLPSLGHALPHLLLMTVAQVSKALIFTQLTDEETEAERIQIQGQ